MRSREELKEIYKSILDNIDFDIWINEPHIRYLFDLINWVNFGNEYRDFISKACKEANEKYGETIFPSNMIDDMDPDGLFEEYLKDRFGEQLELSLLCRSMCLILDFFK